VPVKPAEESPAYIIYYAADSILPVNGFYPAGLIAGFSVRACCSDDIKLRFSIPRKASRLFADLRCAANHLSKDIAVFPEKQIALLAEGNGADSFNKHLHPLLRKLGLDRGGMYGFRNHRVSTLVMAGTPIEVIKKWIGRGSEEMIRRYTHLRPDVKRDEHARVPDFAPKNAAKIVEIAPVAPHLAFVV